MPINITIEKQVIRIVRPRSDIEILAALAALREDVRQLATHEGVQHMVSAAVQAIADAMNAATDKIAARIQALIDKINAGTPLTADDTALLQAEVDRLTGLGKDPENPVPEV